MKNEMRKVLTLMVVLGLLVALGVILDTSFASAHPEDGNSTDACLVCHKGDPTGLFGNATQLYMAAHDSQVGECLTCHKYPGESIHGQWGDTPESCARCHRTHSAVADDLLVMGKDALCLFCHGRAEGLAQTNVLDGVLRLNNAPLRGGGFDKVKMNSHDNLANSTEPGYATEWPDEWQFPTGNTTPLGNVTSKHTLGVSATIWGAWNAAGAGNATAANAGDTNTSLECVSCHDPHAYNMTYRMLTRSPNGSGVSKHPDPLKPWTLRVFVTDPLTYAEWNPLSDIKSYTTEDYSNTWIGNKTWDTGNGTWEVTKIPDTSYAAPPVLYEGNGTAVKVWNGNTSYNMYSQQMTEWCASCHDRYHADKTDSLGVGSTASGDLIYAYKHKTGDVVVWNGNTTRYETNSCGYSCHNNTQLNCVACHVAHGTAAQMTPMVKAEPWPGTDGGHYDTLGNGTRLGQGYLPTDSRAAFKGGHDYDGENRSTLLRIDNRGVCQNPSCHPKGKESYLEASE